MPALEISDMMQKAVVWDASGYDEFGNPVVGNIREIRCRWENKKEDMLARDGTPLVVDAVVFVAVALTIGSNMWLGALADWAGTGSAGYDDDVMEVVSVKDIPDLKSRMHRYKLGLQRLKDTPNT